MWLTKILKSHRRNKYGEALAKLLAEPANKEEFLGVKKVIYPTPDSVRRDAARITAHSETEAYKRWADEVWGHIIVGLDEILDERSTPDMRQFYCGNVRASLDLLRISYTARDIVTSAPEVPASLRPKQG